MDLEFFDMFDGNIPSIIAIAVVVLGGALINNGYLSKLLKARKTKASEDKDALERIEKNMSILSEDMARLSRRIDHVDKIALIGNIYHSHLDMIDRLRAFDYYLRLGVTGLL
jgi:ABC-type iron transport system FetAB ATPase subunit